MRTTICNRTPTDVTRDPGTAIVVNVVIGIWLHSAAKEDMNVRSAYLHMLGDARLGWTCRP